MKETTTRKIRVRWAISGLRRVFGYKWFENQEDCIGMLCDEVDRLRDENVSLIETRRRLKIAETALREGRRVLTSPSRLLSDVTKEEMRPLLVFIQDAIDAMEKVNAD